MPRRRRDQSLRERGRLGEEEPRPIFDRVRGRHTLELFDRGHDVQDGEALDSLRVVERHPVANAPAAIVPSDGGSFNVERIEDGDEIGGHLALGVALAHRAAGGGPCGPIAA